MMVKSGQEKVMVIYGRSLCTLLHAASLSVQCTAQPMHRSAAWLKGGWEGLSANFIGYKMYYRGSPDSTNFGSQDNRVIRGIVLIGE